MVNVCWHERSTVEEKTVISYDTFTIGRVWKYCFRHARLNAIKINYLAFFFYFFPMLILENLKLYI